MRNSIEDGTISKADHHCSREMQESVKQGKGRRQVAGMTIQQMCSTLLAITRSGPLYIHVSNDLHIPGVPQCAKKFYTTLSSLIKL